MINQIKKRKYLMKSMPHVNDTITYRMRLAEKPVDPLRLWHGKVIEVREPVCWVRLTDKGYEGMRELVIFFQIVDVNGE